MTTLNPSHNPFRASKGRHAQAVHRPDQDFPDDIDLSDSDLSPRKRGQLEGRQRIKRAVPPMPDLRFEQSYLLSIRPFLSPRPSKETVQEKGAVGEEKESKTLVESADDDSVFHWGREVDVNWKMVSWVTVRDQILSPLAQGIFWGFGSLALGASSVYLRSALYPASHTPRGRLVGGPGSSTEAAGGGSAVGGTGWWRSWVKSWGGALETAAA
ncbi:hypothetical protein P7C73_g2388, partial [Tremellales sp. Uapishka_1]